MKTIVYGIQTCACSSSVPRFSIICDNLNPNTYGTEYKSSGGAGVSVKI